MRLTGYLVAASLSLSVAVSEATEGEHYQANQQVIQRMRRVSVDSEAISSIGYHRKTRTLEISFKTPAIYRYVEVPRQVYMDLLASDSKGRFFQQHIRGHYPFWKVK